MLHDLCDDGIIPCYLNNTIKIQIYLNGYKQLIKINMQIEYVQIEYVMYVRRDLPSVFLYGILETFLGVQRLLWTFIF